jgi:hypothetical protein
VNILGSTNEADGAETSTVGLQGANGGLLHLGMIAQAEIVVGAKVQDLTLVSLNLD